MRKMFCDKCGKEIAAEQGYVVSIDRMHVRFVYDTESYKRKDLCEDCADEVMMLIGQDDETKD